MAAAAMGSGSLVRRAWRIVAIWSMFTDRNVMSTFRLSRSSESVPGRKTCECRPKEISLCYLQHDSNARELLGFSNLDVLPKTIIPDRIQSRESFAVQRGAATAPDGKV